MLPKKNRADRKNTSLVFKNGKFSNSSYLSLKFFIKNSDSEPRISVIVPKNIAKLAVKRNFLRRLCYGVLKNFIKSLPRGFVGVILFKKYEEDLEIIKNEIEKLLNQVN